MSEDSETKKMDSLYNQLEAEHKTNYRQEEPEVVLNPDNIRRAATSCVDAKRVLNILFPEVFKTGNTPHEFKAGSIFILRPYARSILDRLQAGTDVIPTDLESLKKKVLAVALEESSFPVHVLSHTTHVKTYSLVNIKTGFNYKGPDDRYGVTFRRASGNVPIPSQILDLFFVLKTA